MDSHAKIYVAALRSSKGGCSLSIKRGEFMSDADADAHRHELSDPLREIS